MRKPRVLILKADGINRDEETKYVFNEAGGDVEIVHINELRTKDKRLKDYNVLVLPGGFAYGDDVASGKILAVELTSFFKEELYKFINRKDTITLGICNGLQALVRTGLLPFGDIGKMSVTLTNNDSGHFESRWIRLKVEKDNRCVFLKNIEEEIIPCPVAHGEGKLFADDQMIKKLENENLVVFRYIDEKEKPTQKYPDNPNGSLNAIAGICDPTGRILGLMPHPECFVRTEQHPNWRREKEKPQGFLIFKNIISYVKNS